MSIHDEYTEAKSLHEQESTTDFPYWQFLEDKITQLEHTIELQKKTFDDEVDLLREERDQLRTVIKNASEQKLGAGAYEHGWRDAVRWINRALEQTDDTL